MKLLLIFVSALLLVAQGKAAPANEEPQPEVAAVEVGAEQGEEAPGVLYDAEEEPQIAYEAEDRAAEYNLAPEIGVYVPITQRVCTNAACANVCRSLGFKNGICISLDTCWCSN